MTNEKLISFFGALMVVFVDPGILGNTGAILLWLECYQLVVN